MASAACVNSIAMSPENFPECALTRFPSYEWLSPGISSSLEFPEEDASKTAVTKSSGRNRAASENTDAEKKEDSDPGISGEGFVDFEFRLEDPVVMLPADELFCNGKLVPLQFSSIHQPITSAPVLSEIRSRESPKFLRTTEISSTDPNLFSPKAPRCSSRWKEFIGLKKLYQNSKGKQEDRKTPSLLSSNHGNRNSARGLKNLLHCSTRSSLNASIDSSLSLPLLKELDNESVSISSRLSLSSSSSGHDHDDLPRLSLDSDKPRTATRTSHKTTKSITRARVVKHRTSSSENPTATRAGRSSTRKASESTIPASGVSVDSPRMNPSGKIVFHGLERSSSSPSSLNGCARYKHRGIERSYSANFRVTPVLNVPVCSLRGSSKSVVFGFSLFSTQQKKECGINGGGNRTQQNLCKNRTDRS
ncbi:uncharacterized protein [Primulina huaijiensis]|uniref:uncharacterized protein n=1 Tax=Primulina huaijiensis TaxID=1492673 RepID=UPI003CC6EA12